MERGFLRLWRKTLDSEIAREATMLGFFMSLLLRATWKARPYKGYKLEAGQVAFTLQGISGELGLTVKRTRLLLKRLEKMGSIRTDQRANRFHLVTLVNWDLYNGETEEGANRRANQGQTDSQKAKDRSELRASKKVKNLFPSEKGENPPGSLAAILGSFRNSFKERNGMDPAKSGMDALGKAVKGWLTDGWQKGEILEALGWFFLEARNDLDPLHFVKAFSNGYAGRLKEARKKRQAKDQTRERIDLELIERALEESACPRPGEDLSRLFKAKLGQIAGPPYSPALIEPLQALAARCGVEPPC